MRIGRLFVRTLTGLTLAAACMAVFAARLAQLEAETAVRATPAAQDSGGAPPRPGSAESGGHGLRPGDSESPADADLGPDPLRTIVSAAGLVEVRDAGGLVASFASLEPEDGFGEAAAQLAGDLLAVGAPASGLDAPLAGRVYILPTAPRGQVRGADAPTEPRAQARGRGAAGQRAAEPTLAQRAAPIILSTSEAGARFGTGVAALEDPFGAPLVLVTAPRRRRGSRTRPGVPLRAPGPAGRARRARAAG